MYVVFSAEYLAKKNPGVGAPNGTLSVRSSGARSCCHRGRHSMSLSLFSEVIQEPLPVKQKIVLCATGRFTKLMPPGQKTLEKHGEERFRRTTFAFYYNSRFQGQGLLN